MANIPQRIIHEYLRHDKKFPHVWCSGCSNGIVLGSIIRGIASMDIQREANPNGDRVNVVLSGKFLPYKQY